MPCFTIFVEVLFIAVLLVLLYFVMTILETANFAYGIFY